MPSLNTYERLGFSGCSGCQRHVMARNRVGQYEGLPQTLEVQSAIGEEILWLSSCLLRHNLSEFFLDCVASCADQSLTLTSDRGCQYKCVASFLNSESQNILLFEGHYFSFFLVQGVTACDYWMIPSLDLLIEVTSAHVREIDRAGKVFAEIYDQLRIVDEQCGSSSFAFTGVIASHRRPAHFFYDCLIGMEQCFADDHSARGKIVSHLVSLKGGDFWDLDGLYPALDSCNFLQLDEEELNQFSRYHRVGFTKIGAWFKPRTSDLCRPFIRLLDDRLQKSLCCQGIGSSDAYNAVKELKEDNYFIVWFGIATTKRIFADQESFVAHLAKRLHGVKGNICVLIDGWTEPRSSLLSDTKFSDDEKFVANRIKSSLSGVASVISLVGCSSMEKAGISLMIDFHVTPCGTGSLWTSRFAQKPGLLHTHNAYREVAIGSQLYGMSSSLYPSEGVLPFDKPNRDESFYFMGIRQLMDWMEREFDGLFTPGFFRPSIHHDAILLFAVEAQPGPEIWGYLATKQSRFIFILNEPRIANQPFQLSLILDIDDPDMEDQVVIICRTSDDQVLTRQFFKVMDVAVMSDEQSKRYRIDVEFPVPYRASRLVIRPRQSEGFVAFRRLHIEDPNP